MMWVGLLDPKNYRLYNYYYIPEVLVYSSDPIGQYNMKHVTINPMSLSLTNVPHPLPQRPLWKNKINETQHHNSTHRWHSISVLHVKS